jgi:hypothetical protein
VIIDHGTVNVRGSELSLGPVSPSSNLIKVEGSTTLNLSQNAQVNPIIVESGHASINVKAGSAGATFFLETQTALSSATVDLAANTHWVGLFSDFAGSITINGAPRALFITNDLSGTTQGPSSSVHINANIGHGTGAINANLGATIEIGGSVAQGQVLGANGDTFSGYPPGGILKIDHPGQFAGTLQIGEGEIDLNGLARADSYTYANDMLTLYASGSVLYRVPLQQVAQIGGAAPPPFAVERTTAGVAIYSVDDPNHPAGTLFAPHIS